MKPNYLYWSCLSFESPAIQFAVKMLILGNNGAIPLTEHQEMRKFCREREGKARVRLLKNTCIHDAGNRNLKRPTT